MTTRSRRATSSALALALAVAAGALLPNPALSREAPPEAAPAQEEPEVVAEALFLHDSLPPGGRDLSFTVSVLRAEADPAAGAGAWEARPRLQVATALGDRLGLTAEIGIDPSGKSLDTPAASLKLLLREPGTGRTGFAAAADLFGSTHSMTETEAGLGLGAIRSFGPVTFRGAATVATGVSSWTPHLHAGLSAALELGSRWRALGEVVADVDGGAAVVSAGPTFKVALGEATALMAGALFRVGPARADPVITVQLAQGI